MAEIYGETFLETGRDKIVSLIEDLKSDMSSGYSPTISYVYDGHLQADLNLNAVSVDLLSANMDQESTGTFVIYNINYSVRVHTGYSDGYNDVIVNARLLGSIVNKLNANIVLGDNYILKEVTSIEPDQTFEETETLGGSLVATIMVSVAYTQE